jgi:hypothetical protein
VFLFTILMINSENSNIGDKPFNLNNLRRISGYFSALPSYRLSVALIVVASWPKYPATSFTAWQRIAGVKRIATRSRSEIRGFILVRSNIAIVAVR